MSPSGVITTIAGNGPFGYSGDGGAPANAQFNLIGGLAVDAIGNLYIADNVNNRVRMIVNALGGIQNTASFTTGAVSLGRSSFSMVREDGPALLATAQADKLAAGLLRLTGAGLPW